MKSNYYQMNNVVNKYLKCKNKLSIYPNFHNKINNPFYKYLLDVEIAYYSLNKKERFCLDNEYFLKISLNWHCPLFSQAEYLTIKNIAINNFLRKFYEIH